MIRSKLAFSLVASFVLLILLLFASSAFAAVAAQSFGQKPVGNVLGVSAQIWTAQQPSGWFGLASPVGVCATQSPCFGAFFETGYIKGTFTPVQNVLQQYAAWTTSPNNETINQFGLGNLNNNTWYTFASIYNPVTPRWQAYRNGVVVFTPAALGNLNTNGQLASVGGECGDVGCPMSVQSANMKYKSPSGSWILYDWTVKQGNSNYCLAHTSYSYGSLSWGPC